MVTLQLMNSSTILEIIVLVLALGLSFLALRAGAFLWFVAAFAWVALAALVTDSEWMAAVCALMALVSLALFILGTAKKGRGR